MSMAGNMYDTPNFGHQDITSSYNNTAQAFPEMDTARPTFYPAPPPFVEVLPELQLGGMAYPPPYHTNNPHGGAFSGPSVIPSPGWKHPQEVGMSLPHLNNSNQKLFHNPPPMYNPEFPAPPSAPEVVLPQTMMFPSIQSPMIPEMMPSQQYPLNSSVPGTAIINNIQPMVVTTQTTVISTPAPQIRDYFPWSIVNLIFCCFVLGIPALIFSLQTRSAKKYQDWESASKKSRAALGFNVAAMLVGIALIIIVPAVYYTRVYYYYYYYPSYYYG